jgi:hypothetical protein
MTTSSSRERGGCLTAWIVVVAIANAVTAFQYITGGNQLAQAIPGASGGVFILLAVLALVNVAAAVALWYWKRLGFYAFIGTSIAALVINLALGVPPLLSLVGLVGVGLLWYLLKDRWEQFA